MKPTRREDVIYADADATEIADLQRKRAGISRRKEAMEKELEATRKGLRKYQQVVQDAILEVSRIEGEVTKLADVQMRLAAASAKCAQLNLKIEQLQRDMPSSSGAQDVLNESYEKASVARRHYKRLGQRANTLRRVERDEELGIERSDGDVPQEYRAIQEASDNNPPSRRRKHRVTPSRDPLTSDPDFGGLREVLDRISKKETN